MSTKFYVYGGGRWRELDLNTGRVSGWAKSARIVVARNGRLECSRNAPILRALRALAAGEASRARDGPRLPHTRWTEEERPTQKQLPNSPCRHCCHHRYTAVVENVCQHLPSEQPVRSPLVPPLLHQPVLSSTRGVVADEILNKLRNECVNQPEQSSITGQVRSPQKRATRASSASKNVPHSTPHRIKRQRVSSSSTVECLSNDINNENDRQGSGKRIQLEKQKKKLERRGRPPKQSPANILGVVATAIPVPIPNSGQPLCITSGKWNSPSTPNKANVQPNGDISHTQQSPEPSHIAAPSSVPSSVNEDSQATSDKSDSNETSDESGSKSDDEESPQIAETSALLAHKLHSSGHAASVGQSRQHETPPTTKVCKELVIEERDVIALRGFLRKSAPGVSLNRFDNDDEYKRSIFYRLHPLVSVERSARIQEMLSEQDDISLRDFASQLGLRSISDDPLPRRETPNGTFSKTSRARKQPDRYSEILPQPSKSPVKKLFTSTKSPTHKMSLSKSSTSSKRTSHKKAKLKSSPSVKLTSHENDGSKLLPSVKTPRKNVDLLSQSPYPIKRVTRENDMSNSSAPTKKSQHALAKAVGSSKITSHRNISKSSALVETTNHEVALNSPAPKQITSHENGVSSKTAVTLSSGDRAPKPREPPQQIASSLRDQPRRKLETVKPAHSRGGKEYSPSEDAAIVTWVSSEGRARLVNGNRMWRELQGQYEQLTGIWRTWQSLRNRYLRYILPSLSSLAVPPARAARLRAAAATGEIKSKRQPARRNSIFATPGVSGAWSRRPRSSSAPRSPSPPPPTPPPPPAQHDKQATQPSTHDKDDNGPLSDKKVQRKLSTSSSSSASSSSSSVRYPKLRYSDVTRRFARRQQKRYSAKSSGSGARSPSPARTSTHTRRLYNPKAAL